MTQPKVVATETAQAGVAASAPKAIRNRASRIFLNRINLLQKCQKTLSGAVDLEKG
jgi:hypothetical protein